MNWNTTRGPVGLPPAEIVPDGSMDEWEAARKVYDEADRLRGRRQSLPGMIKEAKAEYAAALEDAARAGSKLPEPTEVTALEAELQTIDAKITAVRLAAVNAARDWGVVCKPLLPAARDAALVELDDALAEIEATVGTLDEQIEEASRVLGIVRWTDDFERTPVYRQGAIAPAVSGASAVLVEARRLRAFVEAQTGIPATLGAR